MNKLLESQRVLQLRLNTNKPLTIGELCDDIKDMGFYLNQEVVELIEEIAGSRDISKPWKQGYRELYSRPILTHSDKVRSEAIDVLKFALNICLMAGITPNNIEEEFYKVNDRNEQRIDDGY